MMPSGRMADVTVLFPLLAAAPPGKKAGDASALVIPRQPPCQSKKHVEHE